jgi:Flp pilus assembly pilin Flp
MTTDVGQQLKLKDGNHMTSLIRLVADDDGQDLIEYALLVGFIVLVSVAAINALGLSLRNAIGNADTQLRSDGGV